MTFKDLEYTILVSSEDTIFIFRTVKISLPDFLDIEDITWPRVDTNFIFECSTRYLTSERSERVRYRVEHDTDEIPGKRFLGLILYSLNPV